MDAGILINGAKSKIDDILTEHGGLLYILPLAVHVNFILTKYKGEHSETVSSWSFRLRIQHRLA